MRCAKAQPEPKDKEEGVVQVERVGGKTVAQIRSEMGEKNKKIEEDMVYTQYPDSQKLSVFSATPRRLVKALHDFRFAEERFWKEFLLTYRVFMEPRVFLEYLREDYLGLGAGDDMSHQMRIAQILQLWIDMDYDFRHDDTMSDQLLKFLDEAGHTATGELEVALHRVARKLILVEEREEHPSRGGDFSFVTNPAQLLGMALKTKTRAIGKHVIKEMGPRAIARELALISHTLFRRIEPLECLHQVFEKHPEKAPNIARWTDFTERLQAWIVTMLLSEKNVKARAKLFGKVVDLAWELLLVNDFHDAMQVYLTLYTTRAVDIMKTMKSLVAPPKMELLAEIGEVFQMLGAFKNYRKALAAAEPPCVPMLTILTRDLFLVDETNQDWMPNHQVNFFKVVLMGNIILDITKYQAVQYYFISDETLRDNLLNSPVMSSPDDWEREARVLEAADAGT